ncbi:MAG: radical SAM protein [Candidatus Omnitrophota bacterium]
MKTQVNIKHEKQDVLLLVPPSINYNTPPLGLLYLAGVLEKNNIKVGVLDGALEKLNLKETFQKIKEISPKIIGISVCTPDYPIINKFVFLIKQEFPNIKIVLGGPHATLDPEGVLLSPHVDYVVRREGEYSFLELVQAVLHDKLENLSKILGLSYKENGKIINNQERPLIENLDELPLPARHLVPLMRYRNYGRIRKRVPVGVMITSRGCPLQCIFCAHEIFGRKYRFLSARKVVDEIKYLQKEYGVKEILFREDNFTANRQRANEICDIILKEKIDVTWMCLTDANSITGELAIKMKKAGCWHIGIGVESGNQEIQKVLKKNLSLERVRNVFKFVHDAGIKTLAFFMIGNYSDTKETVTDTINFAKSLDTDFAIFTITTPFPGTDLFNMAVDNKLITNFDFGMISNNPSLFKQKMPVLKTPKLSVEELRKLQLKAIFDFYLRPKQLFRILKDKSLARAFLNIQPESYAHNIKVAKEIEEAYSNFPENKL